MNVEIVAQGGGGDNRIFGMRLHEILKSLVHRRIDDRSLLNPTDVCFFIFHAKEAAAVLEHFKPLAVDDRGNAIGNSSNAIPQKCLLDHDVDIFGFRSWPEPGAA